MLMVDVPVAENAPDGNCCRTEKVCCSWKGDIAHRQILLKAVKINRCLHDTWKGGRIHHAVRDAAVVLEEVIGLVFESNPGLQYVMTLR
jgi:hypothetical protein